MAYAGNEVHIDAEDARAGRKGSFVLKVLIISLVLAALVFIASMVFGTSQTENAAPPTATSDALGSQDQPSPAS